VLSQFDIIIIGAGPSGLAAALTLRKSELKVALIDKSEFPREKICGDGLCDRSINTIKAISEDYYNELLKHKDILPISNALLAYNKNSVKLSMPMFGYTMPRVEFDNFLMSKVKTEASNVYVFENCIVSDIEKQNNSVLVKTLSGNYKAPIVIVANGFRSKISQKLSGYISDKEAHAVGIRAYYKGIRDIEADTVEFHLNKKYFPGYLWIFPMQNGISNVGYGYHLSHKVKSENAPKQLLQEWIDSDELLAARFKHSQRISDIKGALIPVNHLKFNLAGDNYMIAGDAGALVDPITGGGIGNGLLSGYLAALQAIECFSKNDFSSKEMTNYQNSVIARMKKDIAFRFKVREVITKLPIILNVFFWLMKFDKLRKYLINWHTGTKKK